MLPQTMKAAVVHEFGKPLSIEERSVPRPASGQILVRTVACGVCHTDLHAVDGDWPVKPKLPFIPGHECVGYVAAVGSDVTVVKEGDRVGVPWLHSACGTCEYCLTGWETLCPQQQNTGYSVDGGFAEYVLAPANYVSHIPASLDATEAAPILCAGVTTYKGLKETETKPGDWVAIVGVGGLGHVAVQYAKVMGLHVAAVDISDDKLDLAKRLGAELTVNATLENPVTVIQNQVGGVHGVLVTAVSPKIFRQSIDMLRRGGTCSLVGLPPGDLSTPIFDLVLKRLTVRGSIVGTRMDLQESLRFAAEGKVKPAIETHPLDAINDVFDRLKHGQVNGRIVLNLGAA
jgi:alcohol dehydrogenase, propanol-preferring